LVLAAPRTWLALLRCEIDAIDGHEPIELAHGQTWFALAAVARRARRPRSTAAGSYLEPFALRALGAVRDNEMLIDQAADRFDAIGLSWHAEQTRKLQPR